MSFLFVYFLSIFLLSAPLLFAETSQNSTHSFAHKSALNTKEADEDFLKDQLIYDRLFCGQKCGQHVRNEKKAGNLISSASFLKRFRFFKTKKGVQLYASAQFHKPEFFELLEYLKNQGIDKNRVYVIDLREEPHFFINDDPVSFYSPNFKKSIGFSEIKSCHIEENAVEHFSKKNKEPVAIARITEKKENELGVAHKQTHYAVSAEREESFVNKSGAHYARFNVTDHQAPRDDILDKFIMFVRKLPQDAVPHFHCRGGSGRTSTFMILYSFLRDSSERSLNSLNKRLVKNNSKNLLERPEKRRSPYRAEESLKRTKFLHLFEKYMTDEDGYKSGKLWSVWKRGHAEESAISDN